MASKRHIRRKCAAKRAFASPEGAWKCLQALPADKTAGQHPYQCPVCGRWHLGHPPGYYHEMVNLQAQRSGR